MRQWFLIIVATLLGTVAFAGSAEATCSQGNGLPFNTQSVLDRYFEDLGSGTCNAWQTTNNAAVSYNSGTCAAPMGNYSMVLPGDTGSIYSSVYQDIDLTSMVSAQHHTVSFVVDLQGGLDSWDDLRVTIRDPSDDSWLETVTNVRGSHTSKDCTNIEVQLSGDYVGEEIRLHFESKIYGTSSDRYVIDAVNFRSWHY